jgi:hypothetical protein
MKGVRRAVEAIHDALVAADGDGYAVLGGVERACESLCYQTAELLAAATSRNHSSSTLYSLAKVAELEAGAEGADDAG